MPKPCAGCGGILYDLRRIEDRPMHEPPRYLAVCIQCKKEVIY